MLGEECPAEPHICTMHVYITFAQSTFHDVCTMHFFIAFAQYIVGAPPLSKRSKSILWQLSYCGSQSVSSSMQVLYTHVHSSTPQA